MLERAAAQIQLKSSRFTFSRVCRAVADFVGDYVRDRAVLKRALRTAQTPATDTITYIVYEN